MVSQGCGKGTDGGAVERRLKKSNDFTLGQVFGDVFVGIKLINEISRLVIFASVPDRAGPPPEQTVPHILLGAGKLT